ncbi:hypothetical protein GA0070616_4627 [Micromonospora nigra]|uniref:Uncharacterized protein n=1 Tax=Micromonospora nigra TaxID=145857 RepID=A0A1C6SU61_9ACTN|nr:hypothetical protein [Micromonospora nigra]SCL33071.1 hypothetical protein GA0070616_4627 [Micromonospora nigra]
MATFEDYRGVDRFAAHNFDDDGDLSIFGHGFPRAEVVKLRDHLTAVLGDEPKPAPNPARTLVEVGREYRLLPDSRYRDGGRTTVASEGTTRVRVAAPLDDDGDAPVTPLDGRHGGNPLITRYVDPKYLVPIDDPQPTPAAVDVAQAAREVADYYGVSGSFVDGEISGAFRRFVDKLEGRA